VSNAGKVAEWVLWGFHPSYNGPMGVVPIKLAGGNRRSVNASRASRLREDDRWTLAVYPAGAEPVGLRILCREINPTPTAVGRGAVYVMGRNGPSVKVID
jgi:hypothetical protein